MMNFQFDTILHQEIRANIIKLLTASNLLTVRSIKDKLEITDGNLSTHLHKLEQVGYIEIQKTFENRQPKSTVTLTQKGEDAYSEYLQQLKEFIDEYEKYKED
jgi:DNA-binding MarR family transcriptional regulator